MTMSWASRMHSVLGSTVPVPTYLLLLAGSFYGYRVYSQLFASSPAAIDPVAKCRFRLDNDTSSILTLPDGRKLGYAHYGAASGPVLIHLHGMPGSRIEGAHFDALCQKLGARILAVDRPGFGWSSPHPGRTIMDHARDIERLTEHLGLKSYGVMGVSGGGPYALACAAALPADKLRVVGIICGLAPPAAGGVRDMNWFNWLGFAFGFRYFPGLCRLWSSFDVGARLDLSDEKRLELFRRQFYKSASKKDVECIGGDDDVFRLFLQTAKQAFRQGADGFAQDGALNVRDFGFKVEDIRSNLPVKLLYGTQDTNVPLAYGQYIADRLGDNVELRIVDETHLSIFMNHKDEFVPELIRCI